MHLKPLKQTHNVVSTRCRVCQRWIPSNEILADVEGKPFHDYYCRLCAKQFTKEK